MSKPANRAYSRLAREAVELLGLMIRSARIEQRLTLATVAERAGISRGLLHRIENGEMGSSIGSAFEVAAIVGLSLFDAEPSSLTRLLALQRDKVTLLPKAARTGTAPLKDDF